MLAVAVLTCALTEAKQTVAKALQTVAAAVQPARSSRSPTMMTRVSVHALAALVQISCTLLQAHRVQLLHLQRQ